MIHNLVKVLRAMISINKKISFITPNIFVGYLSHHVIGQIFTTSKK